MATSLIETLNKNVQKAAAPSLQPGATEGAQKLLATKATGRAMGPGTTPKTSAQGEKAAIAAGEAGLQKQKLQQKLAGTSQLQQAEQQEQRIETEERGIIEKAKTQKSNFKRQSEGLLQDFQRGKRKLEDSKDALAVEALGHNMRMSNDKYVHNLNKVDKELDLNSKTAWGQEVAKSTISSEMENMYDTLDFKAFMSADDRAFKEEMAKMDLATAEKMMSESIKQMNKQAEYQGKGQIFKAGVNMASKYVEED